jgi:hypothetical protein
MAFWTGVSVASGTYRLDDVQVGQDALWIRGARVEWGRVGDVRGWPRATGRSLGWAIVRLVLAVPLFLYGVSYVFYASFAAPYRADFAEWTVLATGAVFAVPGVLLGRRSVVTCWRFGLYALIINVAGWGPVRIHSHRRSAVEDKERDINAILGRPTNHYHLQGAKGVQIGNGNTQNNAFSWQAGPGTSQAGPQAGGMQAATIVPGSQVIITDAFWNKIETKALSGVETSGHGFPVVWVERPLKDGRTEPAPWPLWAVRPA